MLSRDEWRSLDSLQDSALRERVFKVFQDVASAVQESETDDPSLLESVPRLARLIDARSELSSYREPLGALARAVGLWNYIDRENADSRDRLIAEASTLPKLDDITLHREQVGALSSLLDGRNVVLSAPTSFGKSILIDALLASGKYKRVAIVVPTIALLDEFRRRLTRRFREQFTIVMYHSQKADNERVIFLGTQERLLNRSDLGALDLAVVDEFYKLDPTREDDRSLTLNAAVYQLLRKAKQFFFLGPNIESVRFSADSQWRFEFLKTRFSTIAVDTFDLTKITNKEERLIEEVQKKENWPALVFVSGPDRANKLADRLVDIGSLAPLDDFADWIDENFGEGWDLSKAVRSGVGIHHGRIPRAVAGHFVRLFNAGEMPLLLCTSTLIEGVNTAAKSVLIFDKQINRRNYDFFTFSNIRGRAGRLGHHFVGSVYLFHAPPDQKAVDIEPPLFGDLDSAPDELVVHISQEDASRTVSDRVVSIGKRLGLGPVQLRLASSVGLEDAEALKEEVQKASRKGADIHWSGYPGFLELLAVSEVIVKVRKPSEFGARSARQLAFLLNTLRSTSSMKLFFRNYSNAYQGDSHGKDNIFKFLRACEYGLPQLFSVVELFANRLRPNTSYSLFVAGLPRWFRPEVLKNLDEQGVPIQIAERFYQLDDDTNSLGQRLIEVAVAGELLSEFEQRWVIEALAI